MKTVTLTLTLGEAAHLEILLSSLAPHVEPERRPLYERLSSVIERELVKAGRNEGRRRLAVAEEMSLAEVRMVRFCRAHSDGDCIADDCPQLRDNEPRTSGRHCPR